MDNREQLRAAIAEVEAELKRAVTRAADGGITPGLIAGLTNDLGALRKMLRWIIEGAVDDLHGR